MKSKKVLTLNFALLIAVCLATPVGAQKAGSSSETRNLFESAGQKQTAKDFKPAPDKIETNFGTLNFELEAFPDEASVQKIYDELDLPFGTIRLREKGGAGGHNGMKSIINHLGNDFPRLRLGIGRPPGRMPPAAYVLQDFAKEDEPVVVELIDTAVQAVATFLTDGIDLAMSRHNKNLNAE